MDDFVKLRSLCGLLPDETDELALLSVARGPEVSLYEYQIKLAGAVISLTHIERPYGDDWVLWHMAIVDAFDDVLWQ